jgi:WD40 repeat protein/tRNA A-37 threonylcarbamoyl transferase component Bud32
MVHLLRRAHSQASELAGTQTTAATLPPLSGGQTTGSAGQVEASVADLADHPRYRLLRRLGGGGMGEVYLAEHRVMGRLVALKLIRPEFLDRPALVERFHREVHAAARLSHTNIVTAHDAERAGSLHFLVMEYVEGESLGERVARTGPLPVTEAVAFIQEAALGLQYAHEHGLVHRDLKPHNLMVFRDERTGRWHVKVLDFGLASLGCRADNESGLTSSNAVLGTADYIAPEQVDDARAADARSDVYALGCTLYHLLTGRVPFPGSSMLSKLCDHRMTAPEPVCKLRPEVPAGLGGVVAKMMAKDPADRYQTAGEVATALAPYTQAVKTPRKSRWLIAVLAALLFLGVAIAGVVIYRIQTDKGELVITTESEDVEVVIKKGGKVVRVIDTKTKKQITLELRSGTYDLELKGAPEGLKLSIGKATLKRGETVLATIIWKAKAEVVGEVRQFNGHTNHARAAAFFKDGRRFVSCGFDRTLRVWDVATGKELARLEGHTRGIIHCLALCPDQRQLLSGEDGIIELWDVGTGKVLHRFEGVGSVVCLAVSPDGRWALSGSYDHTLRLWDLKGRKEVHRFDAHTGPVQGVAFSPDGRRAASGSHDRTIRLWDLAKRREISCLREHTGGVNSVAFSPDGSLLLSGGGDRTVRFWDAKTGKELRSANHLDYVCSVAFSPDGRRALSASNDATVRLWDVKTAKELHRFTGHRGIVWDVAFSPNGRSALSCGGDHTIRLWRLPDPSPAKKKP